MIYIILLFIPIAMGTNIFIDLAQQTSNSTHNGTSDYPYSNLTEALQSENLGGNNISDIVFILVKSETSYIFFDELSINFNLTITTELKYHFYILDEKIFYLKKKTVIHKSLTYKRDF